MGIIRNSDIVLLEVTRQMLRICWFLLRKNIALLHVVSVGLKKMSNVEHNSHQLIAESSHPGKNCLYG